MGEAFRPIAVQPASENRALFRLRCVLDLQLLTIYRFLRSRLPDCRGRVLDVGSGEAPWRGLLEGTDYVGVDIENADEFGMRRKANVVYYDGGELPFADRSFDHVLCTEVLEHVPDPKRFLVDLNRVLRPGGTLVLTIPWSARVHYAPHDYTRFTRFGMESLLQSSGFTDIEIGERGNDVATIANKLLVMTAGLVQPGKSSQVLWRWPLALAIAPATAIALLAAHLAMLLGVGGKDDPLGYSVTAVKARSGFERS